MKSTIKSDKLVCLTKTVFYLGCLILLFIGYFIIDKLSIYLNKDDMIKKSECDCPINRESKDRLVVVDRTIDSEPQQYESGPKREYSRGRGLPVNIRTRGEPNEYQNIGLLKNGSGSDVKPLYGRRVYTGSNMWNYYTVLNDHIQVKLPIIRKSNCLDERGCSEISSGEEITVNSITYKVELYPYSDFRYIPY